MNDHCVFSVTVHPRVFFLLWWQADFYCFCSTKHSGGGVEVCLPVSCDRLHFLCHYGKTELCMTVTENISTEKPRVGRDAGLSRIAFLGLWSFSENYLLIIEAIT